MLDLAHCTTLLMDLTQEEHLHKFWSKDKAVCAKVAFAIQNQQYL